jgi:hypothetical protein
MLGDGGTALERPRIEFVDHLRSKLQFRAHNSCWKRRARDSNPGGAFLPLAVRETAGVVADAAPDVDRNPT